MGNEALPEEVEKEIDKENEQLQKFLPAAEIVQEVVEQERKLIGDLYNIIAAFGDREPSEEKLMVELRARHLHLDFISKIENKLNDALLSMGQKNEASRK